MRRRSVRRRRRLLRGRLFPNSLPGRLKACINHTLSNRLIKRLEPTVRQGFLDQAELVELTAATVLGARTVVPIHYGISGVDAYQEVDDALGALIRVARGTAIEVQSVQPGAWVAWR